jgi:uncharacterized membrane protein
LLHPSTQGASMIHNISIANWNWVQCDHAEIYRVLAWMSRRKKFHHCCMILCTLVWLIKSINEAHTIPREVIVVGTTEHFSAIYHRAFEFLQIHVCLFKFPMVMIIEISLCEPGILSISGCLYKNNGHLSLDISVESNGIKQCLKFLILHVSIVGTIQYIRHSTLVVAFWAHERLWPLVTTDRTFSFATDSCKSI